MFMPARTLRRLARRSDGKGVNRIAPLVKAIAALSFGIVAALPAAAQNPIIEHIGFYDLYYYVAPTTISTNLGSSVQVLGRYPNGQPGLGEDLEILTPYTVNVTAGATVGYGSTNVGGYSRLETHNNSRLNVTGGDIGEAFLYDNSGIDVSGGNIGFIRSVGGGLSTIRNIAQYSLQGGGSSVTDVYSGKAYQIQGFQSGVINFRGGETGNFGISTFQDSIANISGGSVSSVFARDQSRVNITGGFVDDIFVYGTSLVTISGGTISPTTVRQVNDTALVNFVGRGLSFSNPVAGMAQDFSNTFFGVYYDVLWTRPDGMDVQTRYFDVNGSVADATPQGVTFTLQSSAGAPEPGTLALFVPGFAMGAAGVMRRLSRRK